MTRNGILACFGLLTAGGVRNRYATEEDVEGAVVAWLAMLGDIDDQAAFEAVQVHMRTSPYWPTPNDILRAIPRQRAPLVLASGDGEPGPWARLEDRSAAIRMLDDAIAEGLTGDALLDELDRRAGAVAA